MTEHAVVIVGGGPTGLMLAGELALAGVDVAIVERRTSRELVGSRAGGLHSRTIGVLDQRGIARSVPLAGAGSGPSCWVRLEPVEHQRLSHPPRYILGLWQTHIERILAGWVNELASMRLDVGLPQPDCVIVRVGKSHGLTPHSTTPPARVDWRLHADRGF